MPSPSRPITVLCVDDQASALFIRKTLLERSGYVVVSASNAAEALKIFASREIDLVVSDHLLPGVPGTEMARQMKLAKPGVPILLLSGLAEPPAGTEHTDKFLEKTEGPEALLQTVAELLRYRRFCISEGGYSARIACDTHSALPVWHYVIERESSSEIIRWSQAPTEEDALAAARKELRSLNKQRRR